MATEMNTPNTSIAPANVVWHCATVTHERWEILKGHKSSVPWFATGLSGAGKPTLAPAVEEESHRRGYRAFVLEASVSAVLALLEGRGIAAT